VFQPVLSVCEIYPHSSAISLSSAAKKEEFSIHDFFSCAIWVAL
jgi:hypothetical protein